MSQPEPPRSWLDPDTHHRVVRLSSEPGSSSLYFNYNAYTPEGDLLLISTPDGIAKVDLTDEAFPLTQIFTTPRPFHFLFTGHRSRTAYYQILTAPGVWDGGTVCALDVDTGESREIVHLSRGTVQSINADESLLAAVERDPAAQHPVLGVFEKRDATTDQPSYPPATWEDGTPMTYADAKERRMNDRLEAGIRMTIFVVDTRTGHRRDVYTSTDWLNHLLFSPSDPGLLMYCHEGPWHKVDRLWLVRVDEEAPCPRRIHTRTMNMEIAGHEWWASDGRTVWYDLQTPRGEVFWLAGYEVDTGKRVQYHVEREHWSVHFHSNGTNTLFAGDGGDETMVARSRNAKWLYLFRPQTLPDVAGLKAANSEDLVRPGTLVPERLVNMKDQDYRFEPNINFTPDGKWLVFRANMHGERHTYAVEVQRHEG